MAQNTAGDKMTENPFKTKPIRDRRLSPRDWSISDVPERQCTAHKRNGDRCKNAAIRGATVCGYHGGNAPAVKAKARIRLEMAADRMARNLLGLAETADSEAVQLAATNSALDRSGLGAKTSVELEISAKPFERVFDRIAAGPREPAVAIEGGILGEGTDKPASETGDDVIVGELDDDVIEDYPPIFQQDRESDSDVIDVDIVAYEYTEASMSGGSGTATQIKIKPPSAAILAPHRDR